MSSKMQTVLSILLNFKHTLSVRSDATAHDHISIDLEFQPIAEQMMNDTATATVAVGAIETNVNNQNCDEIEKKLGEREWGREKMPYASLKNTRSNTFQHKFYHKIYFNLICISLSFFCFVT